MPLKRHEALKPFSREHFVGLFHAHQLMWLKNGRSREDAAGTVANFRKAWEILLAHHFDEEERLFKPMPVSRQSLERLLREHDQLRMLVARLFAREAPIDLDLCAEVGVALETHIRWEERSFYPEIENSLTAPQLIVLSEETRVLDERRKNCQL